MIMHASRISKTRRGDHPDRGNKERSIKWEQWRHIQNLSMVMTAYVDDKAPIHAKQDAVGLSHSQLIGVLRKGALKASRPLRSVYHTLRGALLGKSCCAVVVTYQWDDIDTCRRHGKGCSSHTYRVCPLIGQWLQWMAITGRCRIGILSF